MERQINIFILFSDMLVLNQIEYDDVIIRHRHSSDLL
jgi:hypothetical protein